MQYAPAMASIFIRAGRFALAAAAVAFLTSCQSGGPSAGSASPADPAAKSPADPASAQTKSLPPPGPEDADPGIRFDGVYRTKPPSGEPGYPSWRYLRFYPDGTVISCLSTGRPRDLPRWFGREHKLVSKGDYVLSGDNLTFITTWYAQSSRGAESYSGKFTNGILRLKVRFESATPPVEKGPHDYQFQPWQTEAGGGTDVTTNPPPVRFPPPRPPAKARP